ncbi:MAG: 3-oxoacyl-ACP reductase FabG [Thermoanaerobaculia bacterium]
MKISFEGKRVLITGGARGIGAGIANVLGEAGASLLLLDREENALKETEEKLKGKNIKVSTLVVDLLNEKETLEKVEEDIKKNGDCLLFVHNAGITKDNLLLRMSDEEWDLVLKVNLYPFFYLSKLLVKSMMTERYGRIVAISSVSGLMGNPGQVNYASSKAALVGFVKSMAREVGSRNITVNAIAPGFIKTPMTEKLSEEQVNRLKENIVLRRLGEPEDIAYGVAFLLSDYASYITGQVLNISGGLYI